MDEGTYTTGNLYVFLVDIYQAPAYLAEKIESSKNYLVISFMREISLSLLLEVTSKRGIFRFFIVVFVSILSEYFTTGTLFFHSAPFRNFLWI